MLPSTTSFKWFCMSSCLPHINKTIFHSKQELQGEGTKPRLLYHCCLQITWLRIRPTFLQLKSSSWCWLRPISSRVNRTLQQVHYWPFLPLKNTHAAITVEAMWRAELSGQTYSSPGSHEVGSCKLSFLSLYWYGSIYVGDTILNIAILKFSSS